MSTMTDSYARSAATKSSRKKIAFIAPYVAVWFAAVLILKAGDLGADCSSLCVATHAWFWYTVFYAALSISAFVAAIEVTLWTLRDAANSWVMPHLNDDASVRSTNAHAPRNCPRSRSIGAGAREYAVHRPTTSSTGLPPVVFPSGASHPAASPGWLSVRLLARYWIAHGARIHRAVAQRLGK